MYGEEPVVDGIVNDGYREHAELNTNNSNNNTVQLKGGDTLELHMQMSEDLTSPKVTLTFLNVSKVISVPAKMIDPKSKAKFIERKLLDNVSGQIHPGQVVALMGPSGSGKTTLLNTLAGRNLSGVTGDVYFNNVKYQKSMKRKLAYVLQQDLFFESLTVKQQLTYTALLRLPKPTSGLDSTSAFALMETLRQLALQGKTIVTSIHQPSSQVFQSFDQLILLADGKTIFMGRPSDALSYFGTLGYKSPEQYNPADYVMDLVNQDMEVREKLKEAYITNKVSVYHRNSVTASERYLIAEPTENDLNFKKTDNHEEILGLTKNSKWPIGFFAQFRVLYRRSNQLTGKQQFTKLNIIQALALAIVVGLCWLRMGFTESSVPDRTSFVFFIMTFWPFHTLMGGLMSFPFERSVINKERASGSYRLSAYFMAKSVSEAPLKLVLPTAFLIIAYWMANINPFFPVFLGFLVFELLAILVE
ncbi:unnamed protein product [Didymodactylos carnosus]|uniref:ABC transporter domain-containing protein n=1 Tax=Didymodactylos carnosus TaxID=1234261 RepID=A0A8S2EP65_9BILA|nr:unnamed protein product [Didymodactylos carnosus]CAF4044159.1 unnamed protein product [Didymodactylos carnosus]